MTEPSRSTSQYPFAIPGSLAAKVGSIVVHVDEALSDDGHKFDVLALQSLIALPDVQEWVAALGKLGLVAVKR